MKNKTEPQNKRILDHLKRGFSLTKLEALNRYGCMNLGARIHEYREDYPIVTRMIKVHSEKRVARYKLIKVGSVVEYEDEFYRVRGIHNSSYFFHYKTKALSIYPDNFGICIQKKKYARIKTIRISLLS